MRDEYVNDAGDFFKFALLRSYGTVIRPPRVGVIWYRTEHPLPYAPTIVRRHLAREEYGGVDPALHRSLMLIEAKVRDGRPRSISLLERSQLVETGVYFASPVPVRRSSNRQSWFAAALASMSGRDVVLADPDTGLATVTMEGRGMVPPTHASVREIIDLARCVPCLMLYQHRTREPWPVQRQGLVDRIAESDPSMAMSTVLVSSYGIRAFLLMSRDLSGHSLTSRALSLFARRAVTLCNAGRCIVERHPAHDCSDVGLA